MDETSSSSSWDSWFQSVGSNIADKWASSQWVQPYEIQKLQMTAQGPLGTYREGQPGIQATRAGLTISPMLLLIGAAFLFMNKD